MCEHLEIEQFGTYNIRVEGSEQKKTATLLKCKSCKSYLTLDSLEIFEGDILGIVGMSKANNMRTIYVSLDSDVYNRMEELSRREGVGADISKIASELLGLGLHHYDRSPLGESDAS